MGLFRNNYKKLVQENKYAAAELTGKSWVVIDRMFKYLNTFAVSAFELEVIKKDLLGLAKEADIEGIDFKDMIGMPEKEFCDSLVKDGIKPSYIERLLPMLRDMMLVDFIFYALAWKIEGMPRAYGFSADLVVINLTFIAWQYFTIMILQRRKAEYAMARKKKEYVYGFLICLAGFLYVMSGWPLGRSNIPKFIICGNGSVIFIVLLALLAALFFGNNYYWDKCSEKYNWR